MLPIHILQRHHTTISIYKKTTTTTNTTISTSWMHLYLQIPTLVWLGNHLVHRFCRLVCKVCLDLPNFWHRDIFPFTFTASEQRTFIPFVRSIFALIRRLIKSTSNQATRHTNPFFGGQLLVNRDIITDDVNWNGKVHIIKSTQRINCFSWRRSIWHASLTRGTVTFRRWFGWQSIQIQSRDQGGHQHHYQHTIRILHHENMVLNSIRTHNSAKSSILRVYYYNAVTLSSLRAALDRSVTFTAMLYCTLGIMSIKIDSFDYLFHCNDQRSNSQATAVLSDPASPSLPPPRIPYALRTAGSSDRGPRVCRCLLCRHGSRLTGRGTGHVTYDVSSVSDF